MASADHFRGADLSGFFRKYRRGFHQVTARPKEPHANWTTVSSMLISGPFLLIENVLKVPQTLSVILATLAFSKLTSWAAFTVLSKLGVVRGRSIDFKLRDSSKIASTSVVRRAGPVANPVRLPRSSEYRRSELPIAQKLWRNCLCGLSHFEL